MEEVDLVVESLKFMVLGMSIVFMFLFLLIKVLELQAFIVSKYFKTETSINQSNLQKSKKTDRSNKKVIAAITAAIEHHNKKG